MSCNKGVRPFHLSDGARPGSSLGRLPGGQPALNYATPLLPNDRVLGVRGCVTKVHAIEGRLVRLDIRPLLVLAKDNVLLLCLHPCLASMTQPLVKVLDHLVVDMKKTMDRRVGNVVELQHEEGCLCLQGLRSSATAIHEERVQVLWVDVDTAFPMGAPVPWHACASFELQPRQGALLTAWTHLAFPLWEDAVSPQHLHHIQGGSRKQLSQRLFHLKRSMHCPPGPAASEVVLVYFTASHVLFFFIAGLLSSVRPLPFWGSGKGLNLATIGK